VCASNAPLELACQQSAVLAEAVATTRTVLVLKQHVNVQGAVARSRTAHLAYQVCGCLDVLGLWRAREPAVRTVVNMLVHIHGCLQRDHFCSLVDNVDAIRLEVRASTWQHADSDTSRGL